MPAVLTYKGVSIKWNEFCKLPNSHKILSDLKILTVIPRGKGKTIDKRTQLYYRYSDRIMIARFAGLEIFPQVINCIRKCHELDIKQCNLELHEHQQVIFEHLLCEIYTEDKIADGSAGCVLKLGTGMGKTFLTMALIAEFSVKTLVIVPNQAIMNQWAKVIREIFPEMTIGLYHGKKKTDGDIVIMIANSAINARFNPRKELNKDNKKQLVTDSPIDYFSKFGFIVFDEIHKYPTEKLGQMFWRTCAWRVLGLTASPNSRKDKFDRVYFSHVGELIDGEKVPGFKFDSVEFTVEVRQIKYRGMPEYTQQLKSRTGDTSVQLMIKQFASDPYRNMLIVNMIANMLKQGRYVYAIGEHRDHLIVLGNLLRNRGLVPHAPEIANVMGGSSAEELEDAKSNARVLLTTYGYGTVGISINRMDTLVLLSPRISYMDQVTGRIKRLGGDSSIKRIVVDIVDYNTSLRSQSYKRNSSYREEGYIINNNFVVPWEDDRCDLDKEFQGDFWNC